MVASRERLYLRLSCPVTRGGTSGFPGARESSRALVRAEVSDADLSNCGQGPIPDDAGEAFNPAASGGVVA
jgi:hypothetical protein